MRRNLNRIGEREISLDSGQWDLVSQVHFILGMLQINCGKCRDEGFKCFNFIADQYNEKETLYLHINCVIKDIYLYEGFTLYIRIYFNLFYFIFNNKIGLHLLLHSTL